MSLSRLPVPPQGPLLLFYCFFLILSTGVKSVFIVISSSHLEIVTMIIGYIVLGYLCGSLPFGLLFSKLFSIGDIRVMGSGNIGATNVMRCGNKMAAFLTLICDMAKGYLPVWLYFTQTAAVQNFWTVRTDFPSVFIALSAILGHIFPCWLKFKGGKGVATALGCVLALFPMGFMIFAASWIGTFLLLRISSLSALITLCCVNPLLAAVMFYCKGTWPFLIFSIICAALIFVTHLPNMKRLRRGHEAKI